MAIILENSGDSHRIDLQKAPIDGEIKITLDWRQQQRGLFKRLLSGNNGIDLDLGCFYELRDGRKTLIDCLQFANGLGGPRQASTKQGCYDKPPYIWHTGDDLGRGDSSAETILVNPAGLGQIKRIVVYAYIFDGATRWADTCAAVTLAVPGCEEVVAPLGRQASSKRFCAIADIDFNDGQAIDVRKLITFHDGHADCDRAYGWGFNYHSGAK